MVWVGQGVGLVRWRVPACCPVIRSARCRRRRMLFVLVISRNTGTRHHCTPSRCCPSSRLRLLRWTVGLVFFFTVWLLVGRNMLSARKPQQGLASLFQLFGGRDWCVRQVKVLIVALHECQSAQKTDIRPSPRGTTTNTCSPVLESCGQGFDIDHQISS